MRVVEQIHIMQCELTSAHLRLASNYTANALRHSGDAS